MKIKWPSCLFVCLLVVSLPADAIEESTLAPVTTAPTEKEFSAPWIELEHYEYFTEAKWQETEAAFAYFFTQNKIPRDALSVKYFLKREQDKFSKIHDLPWEEKMIIHSGKNLFDEELGVPIVTEEGFAHAYSIPEWEEAVELPNRMMDQLTKGIDLSEFQRPLSSVKVGSWFRPRHEEYDEGEREKQVFVIMREGQFFIPFEAEQFRDVIGKMAALAREIFPEHYHYFKMEFKWRVVLQGDAKPKLSIRHIDMPNQFYREDRGDWHPGFSVTMASLKGTEEFPYPIDLQSRKHLLRKIEGLGGEYVENPTGNVDTLIDKLVSDRGPVATDADDAYVRTSYGIHGMPLEFDGPKRYFMSGTFFSDSRIAEMKIKRARNTIGSKIILVTNENELNKQHLRAA